MKRILFTGVSGFLGQHVARHLKDHHQLVGTYREHAVSLDGCMTRPLDVADRAGVRSIGREFRPEVIIHAAVRGDIDQCQQSPDEAYRVNVQGTVHVAETAAEIGARLIYVSTDQVYDGTKGNRDETRGNYDESDTPRPLMVYGHTKLEAEQQAAAICSNAVILRLALMYGWGTPTRATFIDWMLARLRAGQEVPLFVDQYRTPLYVAQAAEVIGRLIDAPEVRGAFNLGGGERVSRYAFGLKFCDVFDLPKESVKPIEMRSTGGVAARPRDCSMNSSKISTLLHITPLTVEEGLRLMERQRGESWPVNWQH